jgi:hypothetical protein
MGSRLAKLDPGTLCPTRMGQFRRYPDDEKIIDLAGG